MVGFFQEADGVNSIMRVNTSLAVYAGLALSVLQGVAPLINRPMDNFELIIVLFSYGFGFKAIQKFGEGKNGKT